MAPISFSLGAKDTSKILNIKLDVGRAKEYPLVYTYINNVFTLSIDMYKVRVKPIGRKIISKIKIIAEAAF